MTYDEWVNHMMYVQANPLDHAMARIMSLPYHPESGFPVSPFFCEWRSGGTWFDDIQLNDVPFKQREYKCFHISMSENDVAFTYFWTKDLLNIVWEEIVHPTSLNKCNLLEGAKLTKMIKHAEVISLCSILLVDFFSLLSFF